MNTTLVSEEEFLAIASRDENHFFDLKAKAIDGKGIQKIAVAFANADGGEFIVGVKDKKDEPKEILRWDGFTDIEAMNGILQALFDVKPALTMEYQTLKSDFSSGYLLRVIVEKSADVCSTAAQKIYVREGAQSLPLSDPNKIQLLGFAKGASTFEDYIIKDIPTEMITESDEIKKFLKDYSPITDPLEFVVNQNLVDYKNWEVRVSAGLLFHPVPSGIIPRKCAIKITRYETREEQPERDHLADQTTLEGPLYTLIQETVSTVTKIMSSIKAWTPQGMTTLKYPREAIWETIVNAVIHRDYSISDDIQILIYDNRIEILSPGKLPGYVTIDNILDARFSRNPKIVRTLNRYNDPPNKDLGEGLNTTFQKMKEFGLRAPVISEEGNYLKVTLPHTPLATPSEAILQFLESNASISNKQVREITGIKSENAVKQEFYKLRDTGHIQPVPGMKGRKSAWQKT